MSEVLLRVTDLVAGYRPDLPILHGINLHVNEGELVTIVGPNGAGKSTLIKAVAGLLAITGGHVEAMGHDITRVPTEKLGDVGIAYVPQVANIFTTLTIDENLRLGAASLDKALAARRIEDAYDRFPALRSHRNHKGRALSGGQRQMLAFARSLLCAPRLLMLDEPSAGLSPIIVQEVFAELRRLMKSGLTILMVEQNVKAALAISDRTYVFAEGQNRIEGTSEELTKNQEIRAIYFGNAGAGSSASSDS